MNWLSRDRIGQCAFLVAIAAAVGCAAQLVWAACSGGCKEYTARHSTNDLCVEYLKSTAEDLYSLSPDGGTPNERTPAEKVKIRLRGAVTDCKWDERPFAGQASGSGDGEPFSEGGLLRQYCKKGS